MFTISHDYYVILGVGKEASIQEIKDQYKRLMKKNHPDKYKGQKAKYAKTGDLDLLEIIDEKIAQAEEICKLLNEAFEVLSDPVKRKQYDNEIVEPKIEKPKIIISPKTISFGTLKGGEKKHSIFTIKNDGGPAASVNIDWEGDKPDWGDLVIDPDENNTFPIKVAVSVNTTGISSGVKDEKIAITVDGEVQTVEMFLSVARTVVPNTSIPVSGPTTSGSGHKPNPKWTIGTVALICIGCLVLIAISTTVWVEANKRQLIITPSMQVMTHIEAAATMESYNATSTARYQFKDFVHISNLEYNTPTGGGYIKFLLTNVSKQPIDISAEKVAICDFNGRIDPGQSQVVSCTSSTYHTFWLDAKTPDGTLCWQFKPIDGEFLNCSP